jgi:hypothetical protein
MTCSIGWTGIRDQSPKGNGRSAGVGQGGWSRSGQGSRPAGVRSGVAFRSVAAALLRSLARYLRNSFPSNILRFVRRDRPIPRPPPTAARRTDVAHPPGNPCRDRSTPREARIAGPSVDVPAATSRCRRSRRLDTTRRPDRRAARRLVTSSTHRCRLAHPCRHEVPPRAHRDERGWPRAPVRRPRRNTASRARTAASSLHAPGSSGPHDDSASASRLQGTA